MRRFEERSTVNAPVEQVFDYVSDFARHGEWSGHGLEVTKTSEGPVAVGTTFATVAKQFGTQREHSTITEISRAATFAWDSRGSLGRIHHRFALAGDGGTTTLTKGVEVAEPTFLGKVMGWRLARDIPANLRKDLAQIKATVERPA